MPRNQTLSFLRQRFAEVGIYPVKRHGQNFLIDLNLLRLIVESADLQPQDVVLEVGTGTGGLTEQMAPRVAHVVTVEVDPSLYQLASEELIDLANVTMLKQDALRNKNAFAPQVLEALRSSLEGSPDRRLKLVANLPYNIATPVISNLLFHEPPPVGMTVTIQKELADRMAAAPATRDYSALSVWVQSQCTVEIVRTLPPTAFWPRPLVTSAILKVDFRPELRARIPDLHGFHEFVRSMFLHRRKFLRGVLVSALKNQLGKADVDALLAAAGHGSTARAEELSVTDFLSLYKAVRAAVDGPR